MEPGTALLAHYDVADHDCRFFDEAGLRNGGGLDALEGPDHALNLG